MAFGFGFNKQKVLSAAEKFVQQGKLPNAITEYEKVLKADPKDLTVMNTVGDLYSRLGNVDKAVECFKSVGDAYASQHRVRRAYQWSVDVAVYVAPNHQRGGIARGLYCRLFELLRQQGYYNAYAGIALPNPASVGFHESMGFRPVGVYEQVGFKAGKWVDVGWWQLELQAKPAEPGEPGMRSPEGHPV